MAEDTKNTVWEKLSRIDVSKHAEEKNGFTYLSWAWAWSTLKDNYPDASFIKHVNERTGLPFFKDPDTGHAYVSVSVSAGGQEATEVFPVLNHANKPIVNPSAFEVNTALQRCLAKTISFLGLGAYIYAGEDLPPSPKVVNIVDGEETKQAKGTDMIREVFLQFIPLKNSQAQLETFWTHNGAALEILKRDAPSTYQEVLAAFKARKKEVQNAEADQG